MKFAFFFPGQGSQSVGMMQGLADISVVRETFTEASDVLGQDFWSMVTEPNEALNQTANTQPLMLTAGVATWRAWQQASDLKPSLMAGHSLGEYTALVAAGALPFKDALPLVRYRAEVMQGAVAVGVGAMAAILGLDDDTVRQVCAEAAQGEIVAAANDNGGGQVVVQNGFAYIAHMKAPHGTTIVDVADPARPRRLAELTIPADVHSHKVRAVNGVMLVNREAPPRTTPGFARDQGRGAGPVRPAFTHPPAGSTASRSDRLRCGCDWRNPAPCHRGCRIASPPASRGSRDAPARR